MIELLNNIKKEINKELFSKLLEEYKGIKTAYYLQNHEMVLTKVGKFVEIVFQLLSDIAFGEIPPKPMFNDLLKKLESEGNLNESIRIIIPRVAYTIYTLRSKRGAVHINHEISPNFIDSTFALAACNWILSEFLRLYYQKDSCKEEDILMIINSISRVNTPLIEEIYGEPIILKPEMTAKEQILLLLFQRYPKYVQKKELMKWIKGKSTRQIYKALSDLTKESMIVENNKKLILTSKGIVEVEKIHKKYMGR